jgi:repressor LexA
MFSILFMYAKDNNGRRLFMNIGENIRNFREKRNMSRTDMQEVCGIGYHYIGAIERNEKTPTIETLLKISRAFNITISELIGESEPNLTEEERALLDNAKNLDENQLNAIINLINVFSTKTPYKITKDELSIAAEDGFIYANKSIPILGYVAAGKPIEAIENKIGEIDITSDMPKETDFALYIKGDSMEPLINNGQLVYVQKHEDAENGDIVIAYHNGDVTCKKLYKHNSTVELRSLNVKYAPIIISKGEFKLIGKVLL